MKEQDLNDNEIIKADLLVIFEYYKVYLVGDLSIDNLKSAVLEALLHIGEYVIDNFDYRNIDIANKIVEPVVSHYKRFIDLEYEKYQKDYKLLNRKRLDNTDIPENYKFLLAIFKKKSIIQGKISISDFGLFLDRLFKQVRYSLFIDYSFDIEQVNIFLDDIIKCAFKILSTYYAEYSMKKIDYYLENINEIEEIIPTGNKKIYINSSNQDNYVIGVFKDGKLVEGTKDVVDLYTGQLYELEVKNGIETGKGKKITSEGAIFCGDVKGEIGHGRIIYPNGDVYIGQLKEFVKDGPGKLINNCNEITEGIFINGISEGKTKISCENYICYYNLKNGKMIDDIGKIFFKNGKIYVCNFKDSKPNGKVKAFFPNGDIYELEEFYDNNGIFIENNKFEYIKQKEWCENFVEIPNNENKYFSINEKYEGVEDNYIGTLKINNREENIIIFKNGDIYMGQIENNKKEGHGKVIYNNGEIYVGEFKDNKMEGKGVFININGDIIQGSFKNNKIVN